SYFGHRSSIRSLPLFLIFNSILLIPASSPIFLIYLFIVWLLQLFGSELGFLWYFSIIIFTGSISGITTDSPVFWVLIRIVSPMIFSGLTLLKSLYRSPV